MCLTHNGQQASEGGTVIKGSFPLYSDEKTTVHRGQRVASITRQQLWDRDARAQKHYVEAQTGASPDGGMQRGLAGTSSYQRLVHHSPPCFILT